MTQGLIPLMRTYPYEPSGDGKITRTVVPWLPLSRSTWPPSCWAKPSTSRPPSPELARLNIDPLAIVGDCQAKLPRHPL